MIKRIDWKKNPPKKKNVISLLMDMMVWNGNGYYLKPVKLDWERIWGEYDRCWDNTFIPNWADRLKSIQRIVEKYRRRGG